MGEFYTEVPTEVGKLPWYDFIRLGNRFYAIPSHVKWSEQEDFMKTILLPGVLSGGSAKELKERLSRYWKRPEFVEMYAGFSLVQWGECFFAARGSVDIYEEDFENNDVVLKDYSIAALKRRIDAESRAIDIPPLSTADELLLGASASFVALHPPPPEPDVAANMDGQSFGRILGKWVAATDRRLTPFCDDASPGELWQHVRQFHREVIETGAIQTHCPVCGALCRSFDSIPVFYDDHALPIFYRYNCCVKWTVIIGFQPAGFMGMFVEGEPYIFSGLYYNNPTIAIDWGHQWFHRLIAFYATHMRQLIEDPVPNVPRRTMIFVGWNWNMGHYVREELPAVISLIRSIDTSSPGAPLFIFGKNDFFQASALVPAAWKVSRGSDSFEGMAVEIARLCRRQSLSPTRLTCRQHYSPAVGGALLEARAKLRMLDPPQMASAQRYNRRIWITIRNSNRRWVSLVDGLRAIVKALLSEDGDTAIIFDGIDEARPLLKAVLDDFPMGDRCIDAIGIPIYDSITLFGICTAFLMPYSNAATFAFLFEKPGVFYGATGFLPDGRFQLIPGQDKGMCIGVTGAIVPTGNPVYDEHINSADFDVEWERLLAALRELLRQ